MKHFTDIRQLYTPVQPTVKQGGGDVSYTEILPDEKLQPFIYCYWELKTLQPLDNAFVYRVVADGCIDIFFELNDPADSYVMGFCRKYTEFALENRFHYIGVRFLPTMFPQLFHIDAAELSNRAEKLDVVENNVAQFISDHFSSLDALAGIKEKFDRYFLARLATAELNVDTRLYGAISLILQGFGLVDVEKDLDTGISPRQLRRLFQYYIGDTPKTFSKVVRFQNILRAKPSRQSLRENKLFFDSGYYDQAHFIKEFKNFYGVTPARAFGR